jgi:hypothetical protein
VKLVITPGGEEAFATGLASHKATRYDIKVDIGGIRGVIAPLVGKQPPDTHVWMIGGSCPALAKIEGPFFEGGPIWQTDLVSPIGPKAQAVAAPNPK